MADEEHYDIGAKFHAHLDICARCEQQPFNLCPEGEKLLVESAEPMRRIQTDPNLTETERVKQSVDLLLKNFGKKKS